MKFLRSVIVLVALVAFIFVVGESVSASSERANVTVSSATLDGSLKIDGIGGEIPVKGLSWGDKAPSVGRFDVSPAAFTADSFSVIIEKGVYSQQLSEAINTKKQYALGTLIVHEGMHKEYTFFNLSPTGIKTISSRSGTLIEVAFNFVKGNW